MFTTVNEDLKVVMLYLTEQESEDEDFNEGLKSFYAECKAHKYKVAVFRPGREDISIMLEGLIRHNLRLICEADEVQSKAE